MEGSVQLEPMIRPVTRGATLLSPLSSPLSSSPLLGAVSSRAVRTYHAAPTAAEPSRAEPAHKEPGHCTGTAGGEPTSAARRRWTADCRR